MFRFPSTRLLAMTAVASVAGSLAVASTGFAQTKDVPDSSMSHSMASGGSAMKNGATMHNSMNKGAGSMSHGAMSNDASSHDRPKN